MRRPRQKSCYYFDTVTLSNFALVSQTDLLVSRYGSRLRVTVEVLDEISSGIVAGYPALLKIEAAVQRGDFQAEPPLKFPRERKVYRQLLRFLSSGEASCISCALSRGGTVATDDRAARECCIEYDIPCTGTIGILKACCSDKFMSPSEADAILSHMIYKGYRSPVLRISDLL